MNTVYKYNLKETHLHTSSCLCDIMCDSITSHLILIFFLFSSSHKYLIYLQKITVFFCTTKGYPTNLPISGHKSFDASDLVVNVWKRKSYFWPSLKQTNLGDLRTGAVSSQGGNF